MAKNKPRERAPSVGRFVGLPPIPPGAAPPGYDPHGRGEQRDIVHAKEGWSEYTLDDGTIIRLKSVLVDIKRAVDQYSSDGNPLYIYSTAMTNQILAPEQLRKKELK